MRVRYWLVAALLSLVGLTGCFRDPTPEVLFRIAEKDCEQHRGVFNVRSERNLGSKYDVEITYDLYVDCRDEAKIFRKVRIPTAYFNQDQPVKNEEVVTGDRP